MSYAISVMFLGWTGKNAISTLKTLVGSKYASNLNNEETIESLNNLFMKKNMPLKCDIIKSCMTSDDDAYEFYIGIGDIKSNSSDNDEDIGVAIFSLPELKKLMNQSFELKKIYPTLKTPGFITCIVSESK